MNFDIWRGIRNLQGLRLINLVDGLLPPPPFPVHALLPPQQLPYIGPTCWSALLEAGWPDKEKNAIVCIINYLVTSA